MPTSEHFSRRITLPVSAAEAFAWHERPGAFVRLTPPWERVVVASHTGGIRPGAVVVLKTKVGPLWLPWIARHTEYEPGRLFRDVQDKGPFAFWDHRHEFSPSGDASCELHDNIAYRVPMGSLGRALGGGTIRGKLERMFAYRHRVTLGDLTMHARYAGVVRRRVLISGASGLIGSQLAAMLATGGHEVARLVRRAPGTPCGPGEIAWNPATDSIDADAVRAFDPDAVIHLAGRPVATRWTSRAKAEIRDSRVRGTGLLARTLKLLGPSARGERALLSASGVSVYGATGDRVCDEHAPGGSGFLADVAREWEQATAPAREGGVRVVLLRIGWVLSPAGGALGAMLPAFRAGLGAVAGDGRQFVPWISIDDCCGAIVHALLTAGVRGPVNVVGPASATARDFARTLAGALRRPCALSMPAWAVRGLLGEFGEQALLAGQRCVPRRLSESGYVFRHADLRGALEHVLGAGRPD
jgi:uncharacterized protein (TIGR01777 family)